MNNFNEFRNKFLDFYNSVKKGHLMAGGRYHYGHGLDHDVIVSTIAVKIAPSAIVGQKAWCASMLHSVDRTVESEIVRETMVKHAKHLESFFKQSEIDEIIEAAMRHSELNQQDQGDVQVTLMDADRLANMQLSVIIRAGQFKFDIPGIDFMYLNGKKDPMSEYDNPQNVLDGIRYIISNFVPQLRLPEAKKIGKEYSERLQNYIKSVEDDCRELNLVDIEL